MNFTRYNIVLCVFLICNFLGNGQEKESLYFYNDTTFELNGYTVSLKNTYTRRKLFLNTSISINNSTNKFIVIDPKKVLYSGDTLKDQPAYYKKTIVIPPGYSKKFKLKFNKIQQGSSFATLNFSEIKMTDNALMTIPSGTLQVKGKKKYKTETLITELIDVKAYHGNFMVRIRLTYNGQHFMAVNYNNIAIQNKKGQVCYNLRAPAEKFHISPYKNKEVVSLLFPLSCVKDDGSKKILLFDNVFTEYTLTEVPGFKIKLHILSNQQLLDESKENDIETID